MQRLEEEEAGSQELPGKPLVQRSSQKGFETDLAFENHLTRSKGAGARLPDAVRADFEPKFGADFGGVRIHTDAQSDQLNRSIQAKAFTTGQDVFFRQGAYTPGSRDGRQLIAHELTHVVQQAQRKPLPGNVKVANSPKQDTIQRFYAVKDAENAEAFPKADTGRIEALGLEWIWLPDPRDKVEYPTEVNGTGWAFRHLYKRREYKRRETEPEPQQPLEEQVTPEIVKSETHDKPPVDGPTAIDMTEPKTNSDVGHGFVTIEEVDDEPEPLRVHTPVESKPSPFPLALTDAPWQEVEARQQRQRRARGFANNGARKRRRNTRGARCANNSADRLP